MSRRLVAVLAAAAVVAGCSHDDGPRAASAADVIRVLTEGGIPLGATVPDTAHHAAASTPTTTVDVFLAQSARRRLATEAADRASADNKADGEVLCGGTMVILRRKPGATDDTAAVQRSIDVALRKAFGRRCERAKLPN